MFARIAPAIAFAALVTVAMPTAPAAAAGWERVAVGKAGASLAVPRALFDAAPVPDAMGTLYSDRSGAVQMQAFGWPNEDRATMRTIAADLREAFKDQRVVTYERVGDAFLVQSGYLDERAEDGARTIFYERTERSPDSARLATLRLVYPESRRGDVDHLIRRIGNSLRAPR